LQPQEQERLKKKNQSKKLCLEQTAGWRSTAF